MGTGNLLSNSGPFPGNAGGFYISQWSIYYTPVAATGPTGYGGVTVSYGGPGTGYGSGNYKTMYPSKVGVRANARYEASVYLSVPGTNGGVYGGGATLNIDWYDSSNAFISTSTGNNVTTVSSGLISTWNRSAVFTNAPANAVTAQVYVNRTGTTYPEMSGGTVMSCWYFGEALAAQTGFSTWSEGSLAMITPANKATYIAALAVDTLQIAGNAVTIPVSATAASAINFSTLPALTYYTYVTSPSMTVDGATPISINGVINQLYVICPAGFNYVCCQLIATNTTTLAVTSNTNPAVQSFNVASTGYYLAPMSVSWVTTLPIGTYTFAMKIFVNLANTNLNVYAGGSISAIAMKK
jgi:hypothetical protein